MTVRWVFPLPGRLDDAVRIQERLRDEQPAPPVTCWSRVAGADVAYAGDLAFAAVVVMAGAPPRLHSRAEASSWARFPYIRGFFAFREVPALLEAFALLYPLPDLVLAQGHGYAHPRRAGMALHLGKVLGVPSIGVAGSLMPGMDAAEPGYARGSTSQVTMEGEVVGMAVRTLESARPVYVSSGFRTTLHDAVRVVVEYSHGRRYPLPLSLADRAARDMRSRSPGSTGRPPPVPAV